MIDRTGLVRLMTMLSPAFPTGGFAYSSGLEQAAAEGAVADAAGLGDWLAVSAGHGALWNDCVLLACAARTGSETEIAEINDTAIALAGSAGSHLETIAQGRAFADAASVWPEVRFPAGEIALPVAVGIAARGIGIGAGEVICAFLNAALYNQIQAAIRLGVTGQRGGASVIAGLEGMVLDISRRTENATLDDLGGAAILAGIAAMNHETLETKVFRT